LVNKLKGDPPPPKEKKQKKGVGACFSHTLHFVSLRKDSSLKLLYYGVKTVSFCRVKRPEQKDEKW
jgi:hypothetical protein